MIATESGLLSTKDFRATKRLVDGLFNQGRGSATFPYTDDHAIEVFSTRRTATQNSSYLIVDLRATNPGVLPNGAEFFPYEGVRVSKIPEQGSNHHQVFLVSGARIRNTTGVLVDLKQMDTNPPSMRRTSLEDMLLSADLTNLDAELALLSQEREPGDYLSLLNTINADNILDIYGRTHEQGTEEDLIVAEFQLLAVQITNKAHNAGLTVSDQDDSFSLKATLPIIPDREQAQDHSQLTVIRHRSRQFGPSGYTHNVLLPGSSGIPDELYQARQVDGRLGRRLDRKHENPVGPAIGKNLLKKMGQIVIEE